MNVVDFLIDKASQNPTKVALIDNGKTITYGQLLTEIKETASYFKSKNINTKDRVLIAVPISIDTYRIVLALLYIGAIPVFMEEWAFKNNFYKHTKLVDCKAVIVAKKFRLIAFFSKAIRSIPIKLSSTKKGNSSINLEQVQPNQTALLSFTSGSSGIPKIADRSHSFLIEQFRVLSDVTHCKGNENVCVGLAVVVLFYLAQGNTVLLRTKKIMNNNEFLNSNFKAFNISQIIDSPAKLFSYAKGIETEIANNITQVFTGGGPVFPQEAKLLNSVFTKSKNQIIYGSTEVEPISVVNAKNIVKFDQQKQKGLCVGRVNKDLTLKIINTTVKHKHQLSISEFSSICVNSNQVGEIVVSGNHVLNTYFKSDEIVKQQKINVDGVLWHKTGDSGYLENGVLFLTGQVKTIIKVDDQHIYPFMVEQKLRQIKGVNKGTVIKIKSKLIVVVESDLSKKELFSKLELDFNFDDLRIVLKIPMDARHHTKIEYSTLKNSL